MKRLMVGTGLVVLLLSAKSHAQSNAAIPPADTVHTSPTSCVILKHMGRMGRTESRLYHFGISGKQFRYVEGNLPEGFSRRGKMTDHDVRKLQARGAQVLLLDSHYSSDDLKEARANCAAATGKTPSQVEAKASPQVEPKASPQVDAKASPAPASMPIASTPAPEPKPFTGKAPAPKPDASASSASATTPATSTATLAPKAPATKTPTPKARDFASSGTTEAALVDISSTPVGADVYIDEHFFGRTPATTIILMPGNHKITVKKDGFVVWKKKLTLPSGRTNLDAALLPKAK